jgi:hypothetical protein
VTENEIEDNKVKPRMCSEAGVTVAHEVFCPFVKFELATATEGKSADSNGNSVGNAIENRPSVEHSDRARPVAGQARGSSWDMPRLLTCMMAVVIASCGGKRCKRGDEAVLLLEEFVANKQLAITVGVVVSRSRRQL